MVRIAVYKKVRLWTLGLDRYIPLILDRKRENLRESDCQSRRLNHVPLKRYSTNALISPTNSLILKRNIKRLNAKRRVSSIDSLEIRDLGRTSEVRVLHSERGELNLSCTHSIKLLEKKEGRAAPF